MNKVLEQQYEDIMREITKNQLDAYVAANRRKTIPPVIEKEPIYNYTTSTPAEVKHHKVEENEEKIHPIRDLFNLVDHLMDLFMRG